MVLVQTEAIPQLVKFSSQAESALDEIQETAFAIITSLLYSKLPQVKVSMEPFAVIIAQHIEKFIRVAAFKCDRPSAENACECLAKLVAESQQARAYVFNSMITMLAELGSYMNASDSMAKIYNLQVLQMVLSTSDSTKILLCNDKEQMDAVTKCLVDTCKTSGADLLLVSQTLDTFFDIFSEPFYN